MRRFLKKETTYGSPEDDFIRIEDWYFLNGDRLEIEKKVFARGYLKQVECEVKFDV